MTAMLDVAPSVRAGNAAAVTDVLTGPNAAILHGIRRAEVGLCLWQRQPCVLPGTALASALAGAPFCLSTAGTPDEAADTLQRLMPADARILRPDIARLAALFADIAGVAAVRLRLEHSTEQSCPRLHVDAVRLRLLCCYAGRGTEWLDATDTIRRMSPGHVALFKGNTWPEPGPRVPHRSPTVADLPRARRGRLLLCIDLPEST